MKYSIYRNNGTIYEANRTRPIAGKLIASGFTSRSEAIAWWYDAQMGNGNQMVVMPEAVTA